GPAARGGRHDYRTAGTGAGKDAQRVRLLPAAVLSGVGRPVVGGQRRRRRRAAPPSPRRPGAVVGVDGGRLTVSKRREELASARLIDVLHVCAYGNVQVTAQALRALFQRDVDVF